MLLVTLNSLQILWKAAMAALNYVDYNQKGRGIFWRIVHNENKYTDMAWGLTESSSIFMISLLIPALIAIKHRQTHGFSMIGTFIGVTAAI